MKLRKTIGVSKTKHMIKINTSKNNWVLKLDL